VKIVLYQFGLVNQCRMIILINVIIIGKAV